MEITGLEERDNQILNLLLKDGRMSFSDIGKEVGLSRVAVKNRINSLESKGIIQGYKAIVNPQNAPELMAFIVNLETSADSFELAQEYLKNSPEVLTLIQTTGECHLLAVCLVKDIQSMRHLANTIYKDIPNLKKLSANSVLDVIKGSIIPDR